MLSNADFPPLPKHISNTTAVSPFSETLLPLSKNFVPEDKPVCQLLHNTSCKSEYALIKRHTVNHVLCKSFLSRDPISVVSPVDVANVNFKFTLLCSLVHVIKSLFCPLYVSILKARTIFTVNTASSPNVCNRVSHISPTYCLCKPPQYTHTTVVNNPRNTSYLHRERNSCFLQPGTSLTCSSFNFILFFTFV